MLWYWECRKKGLTTEEEKKTEEKLAAYKASLSRKQLEKLVEKTRKLKEFQDSEDSAEAKAKIPMLKRSDIGKEALKIHNTPHHVTGIPFCIIIWILTVLRI